MEIQFIQSLISILEKLFVIELTYVGKGYSL